MSRTGRRPSDGVAWLIGGTAGEGLESGGESFAQALATSGYRPTTQRDFPSRIRGGDTTFTVRLTREGHLVPPARIDLALAFNATVLPRIDQKMAPDGLLLIDEDAADGFRPESGCRVEPFPFTKLAEAVGQKRVKNVVALGASTALMGLPFDAVAEAVAARFKSKGEAVVKQNRDALEAGHTEARKRFGKDPLFHAPAPEVGEALFLSGNEAACLGALAAGCRIAAAYPITPASDILEYLTPRLQELGGVALQMEDEIAALNLCVGAGFTGAKALTATSGPGLSLMTETIGLAGSTETPVVIMDCQRPGPSTGMPTKHAQEDLWQMVHGGHGEFVRVVLAPTDVGDAFHATSEAFRLAQEFRCPAFVALDQQASLFKQTVAPFDMEAEAARHGTRPASTATPGSDAWSGDHQVYPGDGSEHPVRAALPGDPGGIHYANSTEHAPSGFTNEDPRIRNAMVERRLRRMDAIVAECQDPIVVEGPGGVPPAERPDVVLVSWGSSVEACREAAVRLHEEGTAVRVVGIRLLWPFPHDMVKQALGDSARIVVAEANAFGQLARLLRSELPVHDRMVSCLRYDGLPLRGDDVAASLERVEVVP